MNNVHWTSLPCESTDEHYNEKKQYYLHGPWFDLKVAFFNAAILFRMEHPTEPFLWSTIKIEINIVIEITKAFVIVGIILMASS